MDNHHYDNIFIPGLELISLTDEYEDNIDSSSNNDLDRSEPIIDWIEDCEVQENLFQIIPLVPEETRCDKNNHIIKSDEANVFFEELGYICDEPELIDPRRDYEGEYKQQQQKYNNTSKSNVRRRHQRQRHVDLENMPALLRNSTMDTVSPPGLSSTSSSFCHTDDDDDHHLKSTTVSSHMGRLSHLNHHHPYLLHQHHHHHHHHHPHPHTHHPLTSSVTSKTTVASTHFSFTSVRF